MPGNKWEKLRAYAQKDYSEVIDFPVELVGKDGVIRRYTYEESLLVYQKRIESAHQRYRDPDLAEAEIDHCYKRIEQLKRSWRQLSASHAASGESSYNPAPEGEAAEACKRFVRSWYVKALAGRIPPTDEPINVYLTLLERNGLLRVFYVSVAGSADGHLLYVFSFQNEDASAVEDARQQYAEYVRILQQNERTGGKGVERLLGQKANDKYGFILTGASPDLLRPTDGVEGTISKMISTAPVPSPAAKDRLLALLDQEPDNAEAHYALGIVFVNEHEYEAALDELTVAVTLQPFHLGAHLALANLCDHMERWDHAEPYALMATRYFPENALAQFNLGVVYMRQDRHEDALEPLNRCIEIEKDHAQARYFIDAIERGEKPGIPELAPAKGVGNDALDAIEQAGTGDAKAKGGLTPTRVLGLALLVGSPLMLALGYFLSDAAPVAGVAAAAVLIAALALTWKNK